MGLVRLVKISALHTGCFIELLILADFLTDSTPTNFQPAILKILKRERVQSGYRLKHLFPLPFRNWSTNWDLFEMALVDFFFFWINSWMKCMYCILYIYRFNYTITKGRHVWEFMNFLSYIHLKFRRLCFRPSLGGAYNTIFLGEGPDLYAEALSARLDRN